MLQSERNNQNIDTQESILNVGAFAPFFLLDDQDGKTCHFDLYCTKPTILFFFNNMSKEEIKNFFAKYYALETPEYHSEFFNLFVLKESINELKNIATFAKTTKRFLSDVDCKVFKKFGIDANSKITAFILNQRLRITDIQSYDDNLDELENVFQSTKNNLRKEDGKSLTKHAPILIVEEVFPKDFCKKLLDFWDQSEKHEGTVGKEGGGTEYKGSSKKRKEVTPDNKLQKEIDDFICSNLLPEIEKVYGLEITHREEFKIGCYDSEEQGFFRAHRDNFEEYLAYRRVALTLNLNEGFEGGGLKFPEYSNDYYTPTTGGAVVFPCSLMHEALPVTKGKRFMLVSFMYEEKDVLLRPSTDPSKDRFQPLDSNKYDYRLNSKSRNRGVKTDYSLHPKTTTLNEVNMNNKSANNPTVAPPSNAPKKGPIKVFESEQVVVYDNFLPDEVFEEIHNYVTRARYRHINSSGDIGRVWKIRDGFPLRGIFNLFHYADKAEKPEEKWAYPTDTSLDKFSKRLQELAQEHHAHLGKEFDDWKKFSVSSWIYPEGTGLSMHDDDGNTYSGAYTYFVTKKWNIHWGGLLMVLDRQTDMNIKQVKAVTDPLQYWEEKWLNEENEAEMCFDPGFAQCVFPKANRIVLIKNDAHHLVTTVNQAAGDRVRMSLAGFFHKKL